MSWFQQDQVCLLHTKISSFHQHWNNLKSLSAFFRLWHLAPTPGNLTEPELSCITPSYLCTFLEAIQNYHFKSCPLISFLLRLANVLWDSNLYYAFFQSIFSSDFQYVSKSPKVILTRVRAPTIISFYYIEDKQDYTRILGWGHFFQIDLWTLSTNRNCNQTTNKICFPKKFLFYSPENQ